MRSKTFLFVAVLVGLLVWLAPYGAAAQSPALATATGETGLFIVRLAEPSLAGYTGGAPGLAATSPQATGDRKLDPRSPASQAYLAHLERQQRAALNQIGDTLGRTPEVAFQYLAVLNAFAIRVNQAEADLIAKLPGVAAVYPDTVRELTTDVGPLHIGAPAIWNGDTGAGMATRGEGVIIGVIDSGINSQHPSFAATDGDGYTHTNPYGAGVYKGWCATNPGFCNAKLIAAYSLHPNGGSPEDTNGHGSHTASTAGGNAHTATFNVGPDTYNLPIQGVAPRANIVAYKVCDPTCPGTSSIAAVNSAILNDMVDVLNYSISGVDSPWNDPVDLAFLDASNAGIFVSASAGNAGPGASTVAKTGPWNAAVAASTHNRAIVQTLDVTAPTMPPALQGLAIVPGEGTTIAADFPGSLRYNPANNDGCTAFSAGYFAGSMALIQRGGCTFAVKVDNAAAAGAIGVVMFNNVGGPPISMGGLTGTPPAVMMDLASGIAVRDYVVANPTSTTVRLNAATTLVYIDAWEDIVAGFSSRGPSQFEILKPDYIAPGVNILAAVAAAGGNPVQYDFLQGTSMSSPHGAGAAALMVGLHPAWSPAEIRSAMASTTVGGLFKENGITPADPFDVGSGLLALGGAATVGLVFNETGANYAAANPAIGGDPKTLNQPNMVSYNCGGTCTWTRTVKSVLPVPATYTASFSGPAGMTVTVTPNNFTIAPGGTQVLTITADTGGLPLNQFAFGSVTLETNAMWPGMRGVTPTVELLNEQFTDTTFPPTGWARYKLEGGGTATWIRDTAQSNSAPASARRLYGLTADGNQDDWLVTPPLALNSSTLSYRDRGQWMTDYGYSGVWISTGSCNPADGAFVELLETADIPNVAWRATPVTVDLGAYNGQTACLAFRYGGTFAHTWWIDDVMVDAQPAAALPVSDSTLPVVVRPTSSIPNINVTPTSLAATQETDTTTSQTLTIANTGTAPLTWTITEAPLAMRLELTGSGPDAPDAPVMLAVDDGTPENAVGLTTGGQFLWLNRFSPTAGQFPVVLDRVDVMFGRPGQPGGINVGELVDIYLYEDADGNPANGATHRASLTGQTVQAVDGTTWSTYNLAAPVSFSGPGDILIAVVNRTAGIAANTFPASMDQTASQQRSWAGFGATPGDPPVLPLPTFAIIDTFGIAGNWLVRGFGTAAAACDNPADVPWLTVAPAGGTTNPASSTGVTVGFNSAGLADGTYTAVLCVASNDPDTPLVEVPVTLTVQPQSGNVVTICRTPNLPIPDNSPAGVSDTLNVAADLTILDFNVYIRATHTWVGDLSFNFSHVDTATSVTLINRPGVPASTFGCSGDNYDVWVDDEGTDTAIETQCNATAPAITGRAIGGDPPNASLLSAFDGQSTLGAWTITAIDAAGGDTGTLAEWCVEVTYGATGDPNIDVNPLSMAASQPADTTTQQTLTVANTGGGTLTWAIAEEPAAFPAIIPGPFVPQAATEDAGAPEGAAPAAVAGQGNVWRAPSAVLYDNGPLVTHPGGGFGGSDASALQTALGLSTFGFGHAVSTGFRVADDFTITDPAGWTIDQITFFAYQTGSTTTSTINAVNLRIWDGPPGQAGSNIVFGDTTTNRLTATAFMNAYRVTDTALTGNTRPIMASAAAVNTFLPAGTYWVDWQTGGTLASGPWAPPVSILGQTAAPGANGLQFDPAASVWNPLIDTGTAGARQALPFIIEGTVGGGGPTTCSAPADIPWVSVAPAAGSTGGSSSTDVTVTFDSTGLGIGTYNGNLCITSNDPDAGPGNGTDLVIVPVELTVTSGPPNIDVAPAALASTQPPDYTANETLTIGNTGDSDLTWMIAEEPAVVRSTAGGAAPAASLPGATISRGGSGGGPAPLAYTSPADFSEGFNDITVLPGWFFQNNSQPLGLTNWFQGSDTVFPAHAGAPTAYIGANFNNTAGVGTISNWMLTPVLNLNNGDTISFWTRVPTGSIWPDRLELRLSTAGASTNVGTLATDVGDFATLLLSVNPTLVNGGYPEVWTQYTATLSGVPAGATGRIAFRYFVTNGGPSGSNSNYIGIDTVEYVSGAPTVCANPADVPWLSVSPAMGTTAAGGSTPVTVTFDSTGLAVGVYDANLCITSNDPDAGPGNGTDLVIVPVRLNVFDPTAVGLSALSARSGATGAVWAAALTAVIGLALTTVYLRRKR